MTEPSNQSNSCHKSYVFSFYFPYCDPGFVQLMKHATEKDRTYTKSLSHSFGETNISVSIIVELVFFRNSNEVIHTFVSKVCKNKFGFFSSETKLRDYLVAFLLVKKNTSRLIDKRGKSEWVHLPWNLRHGVSIRTCIFVKEIDL